MGGKSQWGMGKRRKTSRSKLLRGQWPGLDNPVHSPIQAWCVSATTSTEIGLLEIIGDIPTVKSDGFKKNPYPTILLCSIGQRYSSCSFSFLNFHEMLVPDKSVFQPWLLISSSVFPSAPNKIHYLHFYTCFPPRLPKLVNGIITEA